MNRRKGHQYAVREVRSCRRIYMQSVLSGRTSEPLFATMRSRWRSGARSSLRFVAAAGPCAWACRESVLYIFILQRHTTPTRNADLCCSRTHKHTIYKVWHTASRQCCVACTRHKSHLKRRLHARTHDILTEHNFSQYIQYYVYVMMQPERAQVETVCPRVCVGIGAYSIFSHFRECVKMYTICPDFDENGGWKYTAACGGLMSD